MYFESPLGRTRQLLTPSTIIYIPILYTSMRNSTTNPPRYLFQKSILHFKKKTNHRGRIRWNEKCDLCHDPRYLRPRLLLPWSPMALDTGWGVHPHTFPRRSYTNVTPPSGIHVHFLKATCSPEWREWRRPANVESDPTSSILNPFQGSGAKSSHLPW